MTEIGQPGARGRRVLPLRVLIPNAVTALALCTGLSGVCFAIAGDWERAVAAIIIAGVLDGIDGRIARLLKGQSRFGAELDSLSDVIAFGVSPAVIIYLWSLQYLKGFGWVFALAHVVCCALRLARFNASLDVDNQPHKSAGFLTGIPAPVGAGLALAPIYLWMASATLGFGDDFEWLRNPAVTAVTTALTASLMISSLPTFSWGSLRIPGSWRLPALVAVALLGGALLSAPWITLSVVVLLYALLLPFSIRSYGRVKRRRAATVAAAAGSPGRGGAAIP